MQIRGTEDVDQELESIKHSCMIAERLKQQTGGSCLQIALQQENFFCAPGCASEILIKTGAARELIVLFGPKGTKQSNDAHIAGLKLPWKTY